MAEPNIDAWLASKAAPQGEGPDVDAWLASKGVTPAVARAPPGDPEDPFAAAAARVARAVKSPAKVSLLGSGINAAEDRAEAFGFGAGNTATLGMMNRGIGLADDLRTGAPWGTGTDKVAAHEEEIRKQYPGYHIAGSVVGGLGTGIGAARSGIGFSREGAGLLQRLGMGAAEGTAFGAASGAGQTYSGKADDYAKNAIVGGAFGFGGGAIGEGVGAGASAGWNALKDYGQRAFPAPLVRGARADVQGLENLTQLGPHAMLPDAGPSMQATAQQAALGIGPNRTSIVNALMERDRGTVPRLKADTEAALGPAERPSVIRGELEANRQRINAEEYDPRLEGQRMNPQLANDGMDQLTQIERASRVNLQSVRNHLMQPGVGANRPNMPDLDPQAWLNARHHVDDLINRAQAQEANHQVGVLTGVRNMIDERLAASVPGIKQADAIAQANTVAGQELTRGGQVLDTGKEALHPGDLADIMQTNAVPIHEAAPPGPPSANVRLRQGARAEIERRVGTQSNDLVALEKTFGTPEDWNAEKLVQIFGPERTQAVRDSIARNRQFRETYQRIAQGSDTAQRQAAAETASAMPPQPPIRNVASTVEQVGRFGMKQYMEARKQAQREAIAQIMAERDPFRVAQHRQALLDHIRSTAPGAGRTNQNVRGGVQGISATGGPTYQDYFQ